MFKVFIPYVKIKSFALTEIFFNYIGQAATF